LKLRAGAEFDLRQQRSSRNRLIGSRSRPENASGTPSATNKIGNEGKSIGQIKQNRTDDSMDSYPSAREHRPGHYDAQRKGGNEPAAGLEINVDERELA
jgi:hypothetical protein